MLHVLIIERSAEARQSLHEEISRLLSVDLPDSTLLPPVSLKTASVQELRFSENPGICVLGPELLASDLTQVGAVRKLFPQAPILARLKESSDTFATIEHAIRMGADDVLTGTLSPRELLQKLLVASKKVSVANSGKLIVVTSAKGGLGVSSVAAALGDALCERGKKVCLVDLDFESQDLSRFLGVQPFINENLQLLLSGSRIASEEFVRECVYEVFPGDEGYFCMPPPPETEGLYDQRAPYTRALISVLEMLDALFDVVIVDAGAARASMLQSLYHHADSVLFLVNNDPASMFASYDRLSKLGSHVAPTAKLILVENACTAQGLPSKYVREEFERNVHVRGLIFADSIPFSRGALRWPGSQATMFTLGKDAIAAPLMKLMRSMELLPESETQASREPLNFSFKLPTVALSRLGGFGHKVKKGLSPTASAMNVSLMPDLVEEKKSLPSPAVDVLPEAAALFERPTINGARAAQHTADIGDKAVLASKSSSQTEEEDLDPRAMISGIRFS